MDTSPNKTSRDRSFTKERRLRQSSDFSRLRAVGKALHSRHLLVSITPSDTPESRLGITVSTKVHKRAVIRNRIKRFIREIFRLNRDRLTSNFDIVVVARKNAPESSYDELQREFLGALFHGGFLVK